MKHRLPGIQYTPSSSTEGYGFIMMHCASCAHDKAMSQGVDIELCEDHELCEILARSFRGKAVEWRRLPDGSLTCLSWAPADEPAPPRCPHTIDMFQERTEC